MAQNYKKFRFLAKIAKHLQTQNFRQKMTKISPFMILQDALRPEGKGEGGSRGDVSDVQFLV